jgi:hypothetical protein
MFAAIYLYGSIALLHRATANRSQADGYVLLAGFATAIAVSIRPNYLFTIPAFVLFILLAPAESGSLNKDYMHAIKRLLLFVLAVSLTTIIQFIPYFLDKRGPSLLIDAMLALARFSQGSHNGVLEPQLFNDKTICFYVFMYLGVGALTLVVLGNLRERRADLTASILLSGAVLCLVSIAGINYSCMKTHYFAHYSIMYVPYASLVFTYLLVLTYEWKSHLVRSGVKYKLIAVVLIGGYFSVMGTQLSSLTGTMFEPELSLSINDRNIDTALTNLLKKISSMGLSFYVYDNTNYHRLLSQHRIGDGHPAMLRQVLAGERIGPIGNIFLYSDTVYEKPCLALWASLKDIILVVIEDRRVLQCLLSAESGYKEMPSGHRGYFLFSNTRSLNRSQENWINEQWRAM